MTLPVTVLRETRYTDDGTPYNVNTPVNLASERTFTSFAASVVREYLYRQGIPVPSGTDEHLLWRVRNTFQPTTARARNAVESRV